MNKLSHVFQRAFYTTPRYAMHSVHRYYCYCRIPYYRHFKYANTKTKAKALNAIFMCLNPIKKHSTHKPFCVFDFLFLFEFLLLLVCFFCSFFILSLSHFASCERGRLVFSFCTSIVRTYNIRHFCFQFRSFIILLPFLLIIYLLDNVVRQLNFRITLVYQCLPRHISNYPCY